MAAKKEKPVKEMKVKEKKEKKLEVNIMRKVKIEKVVLSCGATGEELEKAVKLLSHITGKKVIKMKSRKRIPALGVRPGLEVGAVVTLREEIMPILKRLLGAIGNTIKEKQISENSFTFGIPEYIEIPNMEYLRDVGMLGLEVTVTFARAGVRVKKKKIKQGRLPRKQFVTKEEIANFMKENFETNVRGKE